MARPRLNIDEKKLAMLASIGCGVTEIAAELDVDPATIKRRFAPVIKRGAEKRKCMIRSWLYQQGRAGNTAIIIFLAKCELGMKEPREDPLNIQLNTLVITAEVAGTIGKRNKEVESKVEKLFRDRRKRAQIGLRDANGNGEGKDGGQEPQDA